MADHRVNPQPDNGTPKKSCGAMAMSIVICMGFGVAFGVVFDSIPAGICVGSMTGTSKTKQNSETNIA
jgi:hypothetical protein